MMRHFIFETPFFTVLLGLLSVVGLPMSAAAASPCEPAQPLVLGETLRVDPVVASCPARFAAVLPAPGLLAVEVSVSGAVAATPWVTVAEEKPDLSTGSVDLVLQRSMSRQIVIAEAGSLQMEVGVTATGSIPVPIKLTTRFVAVARFDPGLPSSTSIPAFLPTKESIPAFLPTKDGESSSDPDTEESVNEILPLMAPPANRLSGPDLLERLWSVSDCRGRTEPADDATVCSRPLSWNAPVAGRLENAWGDDHDYYDFSLDLARAVRVSSSGQTDVLASLYDRHGQRLVVDDDGGEGRNFAFEVTLAPGEYRLRVESVAREEGDYEILLESK